MHRLGWTLLFATAFGGCRGCGKSVLVETVEASSSSSSSQPVDAPIDAAPVDGLPDTGTDAPDATVETSLDANPWAELPPIELGGVAGFTGDDRHLVYQIETCEVCSGEFHFVSPTEPPLKLAYAATTGEDYDEAKVKRHDAAIDARLKTMGVALVSAGRKLRGPFPVDLLFATKKSRDVAHGTVTLHFGARVRGGGKPVYPMKIVLGPHPMWESAKTETMDDPVLVYANVTKDGSELGIVATARGTAWHEAGGVARMPVEAFSAEVRR